MAVCVKVKCGEDGRSAHLGSHCTLLYFSQSRNDPPPTGTRPEALGRRLIGIFAALTSARSFRLTTPL